MVIDQIAALEIVFAGPGDALLQRSL